MKHAEDTMLLLQIANFCDEKGLTSTAQKLDTVIAQLSAEDDEELDVALEDTEDVPIEESTPSEAAPEVDSSSEMLRSLGLQFEAYVTFFNSVADNFSYLGEDKIQVIKTALYNTKDLIERTLKDEPAHYYTEMVKNFRDVLAKGKKRLEVSATEPLSRAKVILDRYLLFGPFDRLKKAMDRQFEAEKYQQLLYELDSLSTVIQQVIEAVPENVSRTDLVPAR